MKHNRAQSGKKKEEEMKQPVKQVAIFVQCHIQVCTLHRETLY